MLTERFHDCGSVAPMIRMIIANTAQADAVGAAAQASGVGIRLRPFIASDLERLRQPVLVVFDAERAPDIDPDLLQSLRRTLGGPIRYSPVLVFTGGDKKPWHDAGAMALSPGVGAKRIREVIELALTTNRDWVTSSTYIGPSRRAHKALLPLSRRRAEDQGQGAGRTALRVPPSQRASLGVISRRLTLSVTLLSGSTIEVRRAFQATVAELRDAAEAHERPDLLVSIDMLAREADAFVADARRDNSVAENAVRDLNELLDS